MKKYNQGKSAMKLLFLGVFSFMATGKDVFQANMLIESENGQKLLLDCGFDAKHALYAQGYDYKDIDAVYISHLHSDHIGGLEWLGFCNYFKAQRRLPLYISSDQKNKLWQNALSAGMSTLENEKAELETFFDPQPLNNNEFTWNNYHFELVKTQHSLNNQHYMVSYGLFIRTGKSTIFITTDTRYTPDTFKNYFYEADIIFHDCEVGSSSGQHARYEALCLLDPEIKKKTWLYGYLNQTLPDAKKEGFKGFVTQGQFFEFN